MLDTNKIHALRPEDRLALERGDPAGLAEVIVRGLRCARGEDPEYAAQLSHVLLTVCTERKNPRAEAEALRLVRLALP
ncbi:MAG: hypothetical protein IT381_25730 [Deltaproteobacteria bacterium]|nr:hypothetical protein [Deltaproteobacteria bacterium]